MGSPSVSGSVTRCARYSAHMDQRQVSWVAAALKDELERDGVILPPERLQQTAEVAVKATINWMIGAAKEGMIDAVHVDSEEPRHGE